MVIFDKGLSDREITRLIVDRFKGSDYINSIIMANDYIMNRNMSILGKSRVYYDKDRNAIENPNASNCKLSSKFLRNLVQQKQDYGFSKNFILKISDENEEEIDLKSHVYGKLWKELCDGELYKLSYKLAGSAVNNGIAFAYINIDSNGKFCLKEVPSVFIYPLFRDREHTRLDRLVYNYFMEVYNDENSELVEYAEYFDDEKRELFCISDNYERVGINYDINNEVIDSHMVKDGFQVSWGRIPFVFLKGNEDELPLLSFIKEQIDAYDLLDSRSVDGLLDDLDPLLVFKGISPSINDLLEARELAKMTRTMSLDPEGDAYFIQAQTNVANYQQKMESLRRDIIKFGYGVDYENVKFSGNPNQMMIKSLYQNLDTYIDGLERQFQNTIENIKYFFDKYCELLNICSFEEAQRYKVLVKLDRSMMINVSEMIENTVKLQDTGVSKKTLLEYNPIVQDIDVEEERLKEERKGEEGKKVGVKEEDLVE